MKYLMTKIGGGESIQALPQESWIDLRMVGMLWKDGRCICTHATLDDIIHVKANAKKITLKTPIERFAINDNEWSERAGPGGTWAAAWYCWYGNNPTEFFFMPRSFPETEHWHCEPGELGVFDVTNKEVILLGSCEHATTHDDIIKGLK